MYYKKVKSFLLLILVLTAQMAFGQSKYLIIHKSNGQELGASISEIDSITFSASVVTDYDGNVYSIIKIGDQWWMAENLKVTHYRNGYPIPIVTDQTAWSNLTTGAYCEYDNNSANVITYGRLYNWYAVNDSCNIAPSGWHVPSDAEWQTLINYLGEASAGGKLKEAGTTHWNSPNDGATNESGFSALPGGYRYDDGSFGWLGDHAYFWSSTEFAGDYAWHRLLLHYDANVYRNPSNKLHGFSVRLVRD